MTHRNTEVYLEFEAACDGSCLARDVASAARGVLRDGFDSRQQANDRAVADGYAVGEDDESTQYRQAGSILTTDQLYD